jgi:SAM-dependent methyltransferase
MDDGKRSVVKAYDESSDFWLRKSRVSDRYLELIQASIKPDFSILDLGTGGGRMAFLLAEGARRIVGADLSQALIDGAKDKVRAFDCGNLRFVHGDLEEGDAYGRCIEENEGRPFDMAISNVLIRKDACRFDPVLENCRKAVRPGGLLILRIESSGDLPEIMTELPCYSRDEVRSFLERYGYRIELLEEERFSQRFSGPEVFRGFLDKTGLSNHLTSTDQMERAMIRARSLEKKDGIRVTRSYHLIEAIVP